MFGDTCLRMGFLTSACRWLGEADVLLVPNQEIGAIVVVAYLHERVEPAPRNRECLAQPDRAKATVKKVTPRGMDSGQRRLMARRCLPGMSHHAVRYCLLR